MRRSGAINAVILLNLLLAAAILLFWLAWYLAPELVHSRVPGAPDYAAYLAFEQAFPLPDAWVALAAVIGAAGLWARREWGLLFTLLANGGAIFLGLIDLLYGLEHGMLFSPSGGALDLAIVVGLFVTAVVSIYLVWGARETLSAEPYAARRPVRRNRVPPRRRSR